MSARSRARKGWMLAFADMVTLLITFFIMIIVVNKAEINQLQKWSERQIDQSYLYLQSNVALQNLTLLDVYRVPQGILLRIQNPLAFESASYQPTELLNVQLNEVGRLLSDTPILQARENADPAKVIAKAKQNGFEWLSEVIIEGHTDNDPVDPLSPLRNNWFLSSMRAQAVMQALYANSGLQPEQFSIMGMGEYHPVVANTSVENKNLNRRVEILISAGFQEAQKL